MSKDPYRISAWTYDRLFEGMNRGLRLVGIRLARPKRGMAILDVGCGTGTYLELFQRYKGDLCGLDSSASMLAIARERLGDTATLDLGDAEDMPYEDGKFDLVLCMLTLHEMSPATRTGVLAEMVRVLKGGGRILLIDYNNPGPIEFREGWRPKVTILLAEVFAGWRHFRNYRHFVASGGLGALAAQHGLRVEKQRILAGGTCAVYLASPQR
jgi:ubiquinone/menaquinone biosynthesis C-methylase UbiE